MIMKDDVVHDKFCLLQPLLFIDQDRRAVCKALLKLHIEANLSSFQYKKLDMVRVLRIVFIWNYNNVGIKVRLPTGSCHRGMTVL